MALFTSEVFTAVEVLTGRLVFGIVLIDHAAAVVAFFFGVPHTVKGNDDAGLPGFVAGVADNPAADEVHDVCFEVWQGAFGEAIAVAGHDDEFCALFEGIIDDFTAYFVGIVVGDAGYFFIIFSVWAMLLRNAEGSVPYRVRHIVPNNASFGIP